MSYKIASYCGKVSDLPQYLTTLVNKSTQKDLIEFCINQYVTTKKIQLIESNWVIGDGKSKFIQMSFDDIKGVTF